VGRLQQFMSIFILLMVEHISTALGLRVKDGVVLAVEKLVLSKMLEPGTNRRIHTVDKHVGLVKFTPHSFSFSRYPDNTVSSRRWQVWLRMGGN